MPDRRAFDPDRFEALVLYIAHQTAGDDRFGRTKLAKVLFYSDFDAYRSGGQSLTGATYARWPYGPFPRELEEIEQQLEADGKVELDYEVPQGEEKKIRPLAPEPTLNFLEPWQVQTILVYIRQFRDQPTGQVSAESHDHFGWLMAGKFKTIPYGASFLPLSPPRADQMQRGEELARERGWLTDEGWIWERESA